MRACFLFPPPRKGFMIVMIIVVIIKIIIKRFLVAESLRYDQLAVFVLLFSLLYYSVVHDQWDV